MKSRHVIGMGLVLLITAWSVWTTFREASPDATAKPPAARPTVVEQGLDLSMLRDNYCYAKIKNNGGDGWVCVEYRTTATNTTVKREPGAVVWLKNTFTSEGSLGFTVEDHTGVTGDWRVYSWIKAGEKKWVTFDLPGHSRWDSQSGAWAVGVSCAPKDAVIK